MSPDEERNIKRIHALRGIVVGRWFLIFGLAILGIVQMIVGIAIVSLTPVMLGLLVSIPVFYNFIYTVYLYRFSDRLSYKQLALLSFLQVLVDQIVFTFIIFVTGGVESIGFILYFFPMLSATILYSDLRIISFTIVTIFWYTSMVVLEFNGVIPHFARYFYDPGFFENAEVTLANTISIDLILLFTGLFSVFVNRIIRDRELEITIERDKVRSILNSLEDGIIMLDARKHVLLMNPPARDILRFYGEVFGPEIRKEDFPRAFGKLIQSIREQPETKRLDQEVVVEEGQNNNVIQVDTIPIYAADGSIVSWVKVLHDITRDKELDEIKSDFISVAAHQLRTPLAALKWFFKLMIEGDAGSVTEKQQNLMEKAYVRTNEVIEIVNNLLDISEIEEGRFPYEFAEGDIIEAIGATLLSARQDGSQKNVSVEFEHSDKLPLTEMDSQKMRMAIQNLVDNAVKYSRKNSSVKIRAEIKNNRLFVSIGDQGIGIANDEQAKIFSKFFRGRNAKEYEPTGSGLGLYIVKNVVQRHRGQIWFESEVNKGTTFFLSLPIPRKYLPPKK
ncbi:MAG: hypothetical protein COW24_03405 [Candidatus Kerfeldbacteria bacterium CG15_BIG_FIL_POST_REV_8_21_14_020_45_12]|uniref:histidine kinase n=1 Tax=Candidatus Kerfeldbacteria bacterium CG15_BIG_FIL_POST_REV_8_21_14_020_45_12 TaxID=2014247 RepID=A0A2M7H3K6_9BACT|nr:MAG: hypothetical protein COW24_03405 [Candidatus Kerfeldbacteria bacterium CG15_BIG_FIL_POST_REV_8_21_14_020_45_12]PJA92754.1 MAG: hypothetical protein CO132_06215 [Candidatus Kerfeldbacteria bacterium CG_4_9_14_3_um_filter_45_8]